MKKKSIIQEDFEEEDDEDYEEEDVEEEPNYKELDEEDYEQQIPPKRKYRPGEPHSVVKKSKKKKLKRRMIRPAVERRRVLPARQVIEYTEEELEQIKKRKNKNIKIAIVMIVILLCIAYVYFIGIESLCRNIWGGFIWL